METNITISSFWARVWAFVIDSMILGIIGYIIGLIFENYFVGIGNYGLLYGLAITLSYFSIFNSKIMNGQTYGKRFLHVQVVDINGDTIDLKKSFFRASILCVPYFLLEVPIPSVSDASIIFLTKYFILSSVLFAIVIIYIFNKGNRQSIHDMMVGTFVATLDREEEPKLLSTPTKSSFYILIAAMILFIGFGLFMLTKIDYEFKDLQMVYKNISNIDGVLGAGVTKNKHTVIGNETTTTQNYLLNLQVTKLPKNDSEFKKMPQVIKAINTVIKYETKIDSFDVVSISLTKGFNLGIAQKHNTYRINMTPQELSGFIN